MIFFMHVYYLQCHNAKEKFIMQLFMFLQREESQTNLKKENLFTVELLNSD